MPTEPNPNITAVVLAGGAGRRMGGRDKGLVDLCGRPLAAHVLDALRPQAGELLISANRNVEAYAALGPPVLSDSLPGGLGPLAGLLTALEQARTALVLAAPCDLPFLPPDLAARMTAALDAAGADLCTVRAADRLHAAILLVRAGRAAALRRYLEAGGRKVREWIASERHVTADFDDCPEAFVNLNDPQELAAAEARCRSPKTTTMTLHTDHPPLLGFVAYSGTGKTTLLEQLIPLLRARGLRLAVIKHAHHDFDIDQPGKDSHRLRQAGAGQVIVASRRRWALITENDDDRPEPVLGELLAHIDPARVDLVLVEGFKHERYPKVELWRAELGKPSLWPHDDTVVAVASDRPPPDCPLPTLDINDPAAVATFVAAYHQRVISKRGG